MAPSSLARRSCARRAGRPRGRATACSAAAGRGPGPGRRRGAAVGRSPGRARGRRCRSTSPARSRSLFEHARSTSATSTSPFAPSVVERRAAPLARAERRQASTRRPSGRRRAGRAASSCTLVFGRLDARLAELRGDAPSSWSAPSRRPTTSSRRRRRARRRARAAPTTAPCASLFVDDEERARAAALPARAAARWTPSCPGRRRSSRARGPSSSTPLRASVRGRVLPSLRSSYCSFADQLVELGVFFRAQPYYVLLDGNLFPDRESPPSLPCGDRDSEVAVIFNDGSE